MNYRHAYHAGNFADVFKHALQALCLENLCQKEKPFFVLDTHSGIGLYDLDSTEAGKTGEWTDGIGRLLQSHPPAVLQRYLEVVGAVRAESRQAGESGNLYPGSPLLTRALMRATDRLHLCELHPGDVGLLSRAIGRDYRVKIENRDGFQALKAVLPPRERRGMVLMDPPFEQRDDLDRCVQALAHGLQRWASGCFAVWYPQKDPVEVSRFHDEVSALATATAGVEAIAVDLYIHAPRPATLYGCGMVFLNPPWKLMQNLEEVMEFLSLLLTQGQGAGWTLSRLTTSTNPET